MVLLAIIVLILIVLIAGAAGRLLSDEPTPYVEAVEVAAVAETEPVPSSGDAADDAAIWIDRVDPWRSMVIGTDKQGGLITYDLDGRQLQYVADGQLNNVDIRYDFPLAGDSVALVGASNRSDDIAVYRVNARTRRLENVAARRLDTGISAYGFCMYHSAIDGKYYAFVNSEEGEVEQWELFATREGKVDGQIVRSFAVGARTEGCVADDEGGVIYIGVENNGIWKFDAQPGASSVGEQIDFPGPGGHISTEVEGLTLYYGPDNSGYLIASSQISDAFVVYRRDGDNEYVMTFRIRASGSVDKVTHTDGIDVTNANLGARYPQGFFVAQDHDNDDGNQNFKFVSWQEIAAAIEHAQPSSANSKRK